MSNLYNNIYKLLNKYRKYVLILIDTFIVIISYLSPHIISGVHPTKIDWFENTWYIYTLIYMVTFVVMGVYKNIWRYAGIQDIYKCLKASVIANLIFLIFTKSSNIFVRYYVYLVSFIVTSFGTMAIRVIYRAVLIVGEKGSKKLSHYTNIMIVGAGQATVSILSEISRNNPNNYMVRCIVDDDKTKIGRNISSVPVVSSTEEIPTMVKKYDIEEIILSIPSIDKENKKRVLDICANTKCKLKILPEVYSLLTNDNEIMNKIREVQVEDLLGRDPIALDCSMTKEYIQEKTVLVTGGGGSIGSELCRQIASYSPEKLIILDIYENNAYSIQQELLRTYGGDLTMEVEIASVRDKNKLNKLFESKNIDIVFHAAAHKHVPLMEKNPEEAIKNNVIGTYNLVQVAHEYKIEKFVLISTDKAVNPTNIMGATKRIAEMIIQSYNKHSKTEFVAVRFGNVLGSNGSVIPLFKEQIKAGGPVTITHEEITRYFMTIPEAVQLVLRASSMAEGGEIFVLDMGQPVKIKELAYNLIRLSGLEPEVDINIQYTGLRPGEKLYEELLISQDKNQIKTNIDKVFIERPTEFDEQELFELIVQLEKAAYDLDIETIILLIERLVPTYKRTKNDKTTKISCA
ncbi:polysaccharide biosynthesis protein [Sedimentibacter hydroxybenzoicus DSM 7310]|uniref:Polysaccharide biosynthesis protein n=1 Tax=Sedimentibacter hydroxybenzoicus DSM 7310 TaxID=1123245 RepID=A0A974BK05_SEDHY|nr:nucleoside-diphosphate sugar epimerase/dehydratase [Sedimentibacter hydroxybenzoicus]NYB74502.1 polysaccharide biosynthesis protein [Sedimentibacter hydroxybenzoicus DSM 7310]